MSFPFAFAWLNASHAVRHSHNVHLLQVIRWAKNTDIICHFVMQNHLEKKSPGCCSEPSDWVVHEITFCRKNLLPSSMFDTNTFYS
jgi:hypothetical protein